MQGDKRISYLFVLPAILVLLVLTTFPIFYTFYLSFFKVIPSSYSPNGYPFVGLQNFITVLTDGNFWISIFHTMYMVFFAVVIELGIGLGLALAFAREFRGKRFVIPIIIIPTLVVPIAAGYTFKLFFTLNYGIISYLTNMLTGQTIPWLTNGFYATWAIIMTDVWEWSPFVFMMLLAGTTGISNEIVEAAQIDGASSTAMFTNVILPLLRPVILVALLVRSIDAFKLFDIIWMLTGGGPGNSTTTLTFYIYNEDFVYFNQGYGAAASLVMLVVIMIATNIFIRAGAWFPGKGSAG
jgi:multiple sugar transport system permease protein